MSADLIGRLLNNRYRVEAFVGAGNMGSVYRVWDLQRSVPLAMKVLHSDVADDPAAFSSFQREAQSLESLAHPNIVPFYGVHRTRTFDFLLEGFMDGPSLKDLLRERQGSPLPVEDTLVFLKAICAALGYAHHRGFVHCDLKPANVMLDSGGRVYLTDFGIARHSDSATTTLAGAGTPAYMAPEQIRGETVSASTDVYALGVLLFELVTGQRPFRGEAGASGSPGTGSSAAEQVRVAHLTQAPPDPSQINPNLNRALGGVVLRALEKEPGRRFASAPALFEAACAAVGVEPSSVPERVGLPEQVVDTPPPPPTRDWRDMLRSKGFLAVAGGLLLVALLFIIIALGDGASPPPAGSPLAEANGPGTAAVETVFAQLTETAEVAVVALTNTPTTTFTPPTVSTNTPTLASTPPATPTFTHTAIASDWRQGRLVFSLRSGSSYEHNLYTLDLASGGEPQPLYAQSNSRFMASVWSPDGKYVAFHEQSAKDLLVLSATGGDPQILVDDCDLPGWLPDSQSLICRKPDRSTLIVNLSGSQSRGPVSIIGLSLMDWSPLGDYLVYAVFGQNGETILYRASTSGGQETLIADSAKENYAPAWSHDGQWIAYQSNLNSDFSEIWVSRADGSGARVLTDSDPGYFSRGPTWSPDDNWIAYVGGPGKGNWGEIYIVPASGGDPIQVSHTGGNVYDWRVHWGP